MVFSQEDKAVIKNDFLEKNWSAYHTKMNSKLHKKHLEKELIPDIEQIMNRNDWIFIQDSAPSHCSNLVQDFLSETLNKRFIKHNEWPPTSPDCNPLDYHFWDKIKLKV